MPEANISPPTDDEADVHDDADANDEAAPDGGTVHRGAGALDEAVASDDGTAAPDELSGAADEPYDEDPPRPGLTPRQARRVRIVLSGVVMAAVAVTLVVRLGSAPSVLTVGFYGIALILSGTALVLSRRGRTRVATGVLALGFGAVALAEWLLASVE